MFDACMGIEASW